MKIVVIGAGAAGFFAALSAAAANHSATVLLLERTNQPLAKVKISGGGRCNVTHHCFDPRELVKNYPRGSKELLGPFYRFQPADTIRWFEERGVPLKAESDGRIFPLSNSSQTIIDCLMAEAKHLGVDLKTRVRVLSITKNGSQFVIETDNEPMIADRLILTTGSSSHGWRWAKELGHTLQAPVPSLFALNIAQFSLSSLAGVSLESVSLKLKGTKIVQTGPLLITHLGFSGPAALKLSAWGALFLAEKQYQTPLVVNWTSNLTEEEAFAILLQEQRDNPMKKVGTMNPFQLPKRLWKELSLLHNVSVEAPISHLSHQVFRKIARCMTSDERMIEGKTTDKEEFVTAGGISRNEVNFKTMESRMTQGLFFAGEILDIDGVTGGFNFQNAWTTGWIAGQSAAL